MEHGADQSLDLARFVGERTLIVGDVNAGKTTMTQRVLNALCEKGLAPRVLVLDLAPEIPEEIAAKRGLSGVGGRLRPPQERDLLYVWARPKPPRLSASSDQEAAAIAEQNLAEVEQLFQGIGWRGRDMVIINDITLYLQAGRAQRLMEWLGDAMTVVANGYYGERLGQGPLSQRERKEMEALMALFDRVIRL